VGEGPGADGPCPPPTPPYREKYLNILESQSNGTTPSEGYLTKLCRRSFLSLWSYANLYTDEGRKRGKGVGHELCDLLVVFGNDIIIFSVKHIKFNRLIDPLIAWKRWCNKAVFKSANQLYGAETWLRRYPDRIFLDSRCQIKFPVQLPPIEHIRIHRIVVALGVFEACKTFFGGDSLGSLMVMSDLIGDAHLENPFRIGHVNPEKGFVHVFDDLIFDICLRELDTVSDFVGYLMKKEYILSQLNPLIHAAGEEQLISLYLAKTNEAGEHDFNLPKGHDGIFLDEGSWERMIQNPQYIAKKEADRISYSWDQLIEHFIEYGYGYDLSGKMQLPITEQEPALRLMASESRLRRRQLGHALISLIEIAKSEGRTRLVYSNDFPDIAYLFLVLPQHINQCYEEYRERRKFLLLAYCKVAKLVAPKAKYIVGIAMEPSGTRGGTEELIALEVDDWTPEMEQEAKTLQQEGSLLLEKNIQRFEGRTQEYPEVPQVLRPNDNHIRLNRRQRRALRRKKG
jgi:hypothetical protein